MLSEKAANNGGEIAVGQPPRTGAGLRHGGAGLRPRRSGGERIRRGRGSGGDPAEAPARLEAQHVRRQGTQPAVRPGAAKRARLLPDRPAGRCCCTDPFAPYGALPLLQIGEMRHNRWSGACAGKGSVPSAGTDPFRCVSPGGAYCGRNVGVADSQTVETSKLLTFRVGFCDGAALTWGPAEGGPAAGQAACLRACERRAVRPAGPGRHGVVGQGQLTACSEPRRLAAAAFLAAAWAARFSRCRASWSW